MDPKKAASGDVMDNIDRFCTCPICKKQLDDPRRLPCAHRYCLKCLDKAVRGFQAKNQGQKFPCPKCRQEFPIPERGAVDMKKDFWVTEMQTLTELRDKLASGTKTGPCACCSNTAELIAFCTNCDGFVCVNCCNLHETLGVLKTHTNIFKLDNAVKKNKGKIDMKKLLAITAAPTCRDHKGMELELSCRTCDDLLICLKCAFVRHGDHEKQDVSDAVKSLRDELRREKASLHSKRQGSLACRKQNEKNVEKIASMFDNIASGIENKHKFGMSKCEEEQTLLTSADAEEIDNIECGRDFDISSYEKTAEETIEAIKREMNKKITAINDDLAYKVKTRKDNAQHHIETIEARMNAKIKGINDKREQLDEDKEKLLNLVASCKKSVSAQLNDCNKTIDEILIRLQYVTENVNAVEQVSSIWSFVETMSDLLNIMGGMNKTLDDVQFDSQSLNTPVLAFDPSNTPYRIGHLMWTINRKFTVVEAGRFAKEEWKIDDVTSLANGNLAVAGPGPDKESAVDFLTPDSQTLQTKDFLFDDNNPWCLCSADRHRMLACRGADIDILNINSGESLRKVNMKRIPRWRLDDKLVSVAYDGNMNEVMVCRQKSNEVFVFDRELKFLRSFKMPGPSKGPFTMVISGDTLLACTVLGEGNGIGVDLGTINIVSRFQQIEPGQKALSICCDSAGHVYIMWKRDQGIWIVQYESNGEPSLGLPVHPAASRTTVVKSKDGSEDLLVATPDGRVAFYKLPLRKSSSWKNDSSWFAGINQEVLEKYLSRRFHWLPTTQGYGLKEAFDVDLSDRVVIQPPVLQQQSQQPLQSQPPLQSYSQSPLQSQPPLQAYTQSPLQSQPPRQSYSQSPLQSQSPRQPQTPQSRMQPMPNRGGRDHTFMV